MNRHPWDKIRLDNDKDALWEIFHENSKLSQYDSFPSDSEISDKVNKLRQSLDFHGMQKVDLPTSLIPLKIPLEDVITTRVTTRNMTRSTLNLKNIATILHYAYGVTRDNRESHTTLKFRNVPSAGALYPLEIFFHASQIEEYPSGIYHYNPIQNNIRLIRKGDETLRISEALVQKEISHNSSLIFFITAMFERSTFKYSERGYRFVLMEAGHVAQNINLVVNAMGLGSINLGGFWDRKIDELLGIDGVVHSTIYLIAVGRDNDKKISK